MTYTFYINTMYPSANICDICFSNLSLAKAGMHLCETSVLIVLFKINTSIIQSIACLLVLTFRLQYLKHHNCALSSYRHSEFSSFNLTVEFKAFKRPHSTERAYRLCLNTDTCLNGNWRWRTLCHGMLSHIYQYQCWNACSNQRHSQNDIVSTK